MTWTTNQMAFDSPPPSSQLLNYTSLRVDSFESTRKRKKRLSGTMEEESSFHECRFGRISEKKEKKLVDLDCFFLEIERIPSNLLFDSTNSKFEKFFRIMDNGAKTRATIRVALSIIPRKHRRFCDDFAWDGLWEGRGGGKPRKERLISRPESISTRRND